MMDIDLIKQVVKQMIRDGEIEVKADVYESKIDTDDFGNSCGALESVEVEVYLEVGEG